MRRSDGHCKGKCGQATTRGYRKQQANPESEKTKQADTTKKTEIDACEGYTERRGVISIDGECKKQEPPTQAAKWLLLGQEHCGSSINGNR